MYCTYFHCSDLLLFFICSSDVLEEKSGLCSTVVSSNSKQFTLLLLLFGLVCVYIFMGYKWFFVFQFELCCCFGFFFSVCTPPHIAYYLVYEICCETSTEITKANETHKNRTNMTKKKRKTRQVNQQSTLKMQHSKIYDAIIATLKNTHSRWRTRDGDYKQKKVRNSNRIEIQKNTIRLCSRFNFEHDHEAIQQFLDKFNLFVLLFPYRLKFVDTLFDIF